MRGVIFSGPSVRAILDGTKTQTRRAVKCQDAVEPHPDNERIANWVHDERMLHPCDYACTRDQWSRCPYGDVGTRLWVREAWAARLDQDHLAPRDLPRTSSIGYWADGPGRCCNTGCAGGAGRVRPSIHMPRWASRLTLEVESIRVERLQEITKEDARAEGAEKRRAGQGYLGPIKTHRTGFVSAWNTINGKRPGCAWADDPWAWVLGFRCVEGSAPCTE